MQELTSQHSHRSFGNGSLVYTTLLYISAFIIGLNIPAISNLIIFALFFFLLRSSNKINIERYLLQILLLTSFALMYYLIIYYYGYLDLRHSIQYIFLMTVAYGIGISINLDKLSGRLYGIIFLIFFLIAGFIVFSYLSLSKISTEIQGIIILTRAAPGFWSGAEEEYINGPVFGMFASIAICLFPALFFSQGKSFADRIVQILILCLFISGLYINIRVQNRLPYFSLLIAVLFSFLFYFISRNKNYSSLRVNILIPIIFFIAIIPMFEYINNILNEYVTPRFVAYGMDTERFETWKYMISNLFIYLKGGRQVYIGTNNFVHNIWLNVAEDAGLFPFILLLVFHLSHYKSVSAFIVSSYPIQFKIILICIGISFIISFMGEPVLVASPLYFACSCLILGIVKKMSTDIEDIPERKK